MKQVRVNVRAKADTKAVRKEKRNGRDVLVVPSATLPDGIVMNGIRYPADEIAKGFKSLERTPAPLGHPMVNGQFVSATDPEGINIGHIGAWNENVRREKGRVFLDKVIDIEVASRTAGGKAVLAAVNAGDPVHTSTGLLCNLDPVTNEDGVTAVARNIHFDHDAILLNEDGAAKPEQGVGMLVNGQTIDVINSAIEEADRELDWAGMRLVEALERRQRASFWEQLKSAFMGAMPTEREPVSNQEEDPMTVSKEQFDELSVKVNALSETIAKLDIGKAVADAIKPLTDNLATMQANAEASAKAEKDALIAKVVKANVLSKEAADGLTVNALKELADKLATPGTAAGLNAAFKGNASDDEFAGYDLNAAIEKVK